MEKCRKLQEGYEIEPMVFLARFVLGTMVNVFEIEDMGPYKGLPPKAKENQHAASA